LAGASNGEEAKMNRIILDDLKRRWWFWGLLGLACLVCGLCVQANVNFFYGALYPAMLGAVVLGLQMRNGRVLLTLPFTARQIGRTVWVLMVVIPSLLLALFTGPGIYLARFLKISADETILAVFPATLSGGFLAAWIQLTIVGSLGFGSAFWLFTRIPPIREQRNNLRTQLYCFGLLITVLGGGYLLARSNIGNEIKFVIICLPGVFLTVRGWFRAEGMVIGFGSYRNETASVGKPKEMFKPRAGYGGIPFLIMNCCIRYVVVMLCIIALASGITLWAVTHDPTNPPVKRSDFLDLMKGFSFYGVILSFWMLFPSAVHQKFLRSLPLTSKKLAAVILCIPVLPYLILCGIVALVEIPVFGFSPAMFSIEAQLLYLTPICVFATAFVWNNEKKVLRFFIALGVFILSTIPAIYHLFRTSGRGLPLWMIITIPLVSCLLALYIINRLLQRNDMTYRAQMQIFLGPEPAIW
jgi:hypothetical protein